MLPGWSRRTCTPCQTLCRGAADDLPLLAWLSERPFPSGGAKTEDDPRRRRSLLRRSCCLGNDGDLRYGDGSHQDVGARRFGGDWPARHGGRR